MRGKSHICLGNYLLRRYLPDLSPVKSKAFLLGCIEPDRNPVTYLKGSFRCQWLRGHNFGNARRFMERLSVRLEQKTDLNLFDYYTLGKLIHYTADAFTLAHNDTFPEKLSRHRDYENRLQEYFLSYIHADPYVDVPYAKTIMEGIYIHHREYTRNSAGIHTDSRFALQACCCVLAVLMAPRLI